MTYTTVLFDLDGTLTDSATGITNSLAYVVSALGLPPVDPTRIRGLVGPPLDEILAALGVDPRQNDVALGHYRTHYGDVGMFQNAVFDGIPELLGQLGDAGVSLAVATSKLTASAERILRHFQLLDHFRYVAGSTADGARQHKDAVIAHALAGLRLDSPAGVIMVGDREHDVIGARANAMDCVAVRWGYGSDEELLAAGATRLVSDRPQLRAVLVGEATTQAHAHHVVDHATLTRDTPRGRVTIA